MINTPQFCGKMTIVLHGDSMLRQVLETMEQAQGPIPMDELSRQLVGH
ncbi:MAG: hypothetical protein AAGF95_13260 [Chloroflexota bacterium]